MPLLTGIKHTLVRIEARVSRQQGRVDIQDLALVVLDEPRAQNAHETGENQQVRRKLIKFRSNRAIEGFTIVEIAMLDAGGLDAGLPRAREAIRIGAIAEHQAKVEIDHAGIDLVDERLQV